jgi:hypothetical protein
LTVVVAVTFPLPVAVTTSEYIPEDVPTVGGGLASVPVTPHPSHITVTIITSAAIGTRLIKRRRRSLFDQLENTNVAAASKHQNATRPGENGFTRRKVRNGAATPPAVVITLNEIDPPATIVPGENVHVETGGHPAIEKATCPLNGGLKVLIANVADAPALTAIADGDAISPAGIGPLKLITVAPPHSAEFVPPGGHCVVSNTVTMKKYVVACATAICTCDCTTDAEMLLLQATLVKFPGPPVYAESTVSYELPSVLTASVPELPAVYLHQTDFPVGF